MIPEPMNAELDEILTKQLAALEAEKRAPHPASPLGRYLGEARDRHRARQEGKSLPEVGLRAKSAVPTPNGTTRTRPGEHARAIAASDPTSDFAKAIDAQTAFVDGITGNFAKRRELAQRAVAELEGRLAKSAGDGKPVTLKVVRKKSS